MGRAEQQELPAWLESLRASDYSAPPATEQPNFSPTDLVDEGALPGWMRPENGDMADSVSAQYPAIRRASMPGPTTDGGMLPPRSIMASSLIDEQALPSWLQEHSTTEPQPVQRGFSAASLVQPDALPDWMRNMQPPAAPPAPANTPPVEPSNFELPARGMAPYGLVDQQALPSSSSGQGNMPSEPASGEGQMRLPASSLLDVNALPPWMQEGRSGYQSQGQGSSNEERRPAAQPGQLSTGDTSLAAASLIDMNALPEWLREGEEQQRSMQGQRQQPWSAGYVQPGGPGVPPRVENIRVPSRPRTEANVQEQNQVAANVFSSMLGVSSAPYFPGQPQPGSGTTNQASSWQGTQPGQPQQPPTYAPGAMPGRGQPQVQQQPMNPSAAVPPQNNAVPGMQPGAPQVSMGYQGGYPHAPGAYPAGNQADVPVQAQPSNSPVGRQPGPVMNGPTGSNGYTQSTGPNRLSQKNTGKRGIIETIRGWFSR
jgi:hypothetical protein